ncbi:MAG: integrase, partial [Candidatus Methanosuratincola sp.]
PCGCQASRGSGPGLLRNQGVKVTPKVLRFWFANEMARLGVPDRFIDAFQGRIPRSVLARHYTDYSLENLKAIYDRAELKVLS